MLIYGWNSIGEFRRTDNTLNSGTLSLDLRTSPPKMGAPLKDIRASAKHEAIHLLVGRLEQDGRYRYSSESEIYEATEGLVHRLENLI